MRRVTEHWHPDNASLSINRRRDARLAVRAIESTAVLSGDSRMWHMRVNRLPHPSHRNTAADETITFRSDEAGLVVEALASYVSGLENRPLLTRRAQSLIGELVVAAGPAILANPTQPVQPHLET